MILKAWLGLHPYLQATAELHALIERAVDDVDLSVLPAPKLDPYLEDFRAGVPLLQSPSVAIDLEHAAVPLALLVEMAARLPLPGELAAESQELLAELHGDPDTPGRWLTWLLDRDSLEPAGPGLLLFLGWTVLARYLRPVVVEFSRWRDEERWLNNYCPTCAAPPAMAQLVGTDPGRMRFLSCGCCRTRWRFQRTLCPFCDSDEQELLTLAIEGEKNLRIDYCKSCSGYLKTYIGQGSENLYLADWTTVHLDVIARDNGLKRLAASIYDL